MGRKLGSGNREKMGVSEELSSAPCGLLFSSGCVEEGNAGTWGSQEGQVQGLGLTWWHGQCWGWRETGMGQGECLDFWLIMQGPVTPWLYGTYMGLVREQMI